ncbi:hypothetical protein GGR01_000992 [Acetobacter oeni]|nr:hypothetical protein [Acetobacter oeni]
MIVSGRSDGVLRGNPWPCYVVVSEWRIQFFVFAPIFIREAVSI